jgi:fatty-acyl-CoA synthase
MPLFHVGGAIATGLAFLLQGAHVLMLSAQGFRNPAMVAHLWSLVERHGVTILAAVPTALASILSIPVNGRLDSVRYGLTGAALCPAGVSARFGQVTGKPLHELLGMTETGGVTAADPAGGTPTRGSVGFGVPSGQLRVRRRLPDGQLGEDCDTGEIGVLFVTGDNVSPGYLDASQNEGVFTGAGLDSGDLAYFDAEGKLFIAGRSKDLIIRSGHNIDPAMIEQAFAAHPDVEATAAVGQPDPYAGELPVVFLVLRNPATDLKAVEAFARERIAERPAWPKAVYTVDTLPLTAVGKPFKPALRAEAAVRLLQPRLREVTGDDSLQVIAAEGGKRGLDVQVLPGSAGSDALALSLVQRELDGYPFAWRIVHGAG